MLESGSRTRTRQAILHAAIELLGRNPAASLGEIAAAAEVGRTTLHRYFAERSDLMAAVGAEGARRLAGAIEQARLAEGTGNSAVQRLCREYFELGGLLSLIFSESVVIDDPAMCVPGDEKWFVDVVARGHRDGSIDPALPADWVTSVLWSQLYAGWSYMAETGASRARALELVVRTVSGAIRPHR